MTGQDVGRRHRLESSTFSSPRSRPTSVSPQTYLGLAVMPVLFCLAHLTFGTNQPAAALWLTTLLGAALAVCLISPLRAGLHDVTFLAPVAILFTFVSAVGLWSLTPWGPGGPHPLWAWAGDAPASLTIDRGATLLELVKLAGLGSVFLVGVLHAVRRDLAEATTEAIVWTGGAYGAISLLSFLSGNQLAQGGRLSGGFLSSNNGATVFGVLAVIALAVFLRAWRRTGGLGISSRLTRIAAPLACLGLTTICLLLTASRMGVAATLLAVGVLLIWETVSSGAKARLAIASAALVLMGLATTLIIGGNALLLTRVGDVGVDLATRKEIFSAHWDAFLASPIFGYGLGTFDAVNVQIMTAETARTSWSIRATHNAYLQWLEEAGLVGALPMFGLILVIIGRSLLRTLRAKGRALQRGLVCANIIVLVHATTDYALQTPSIAAFWSFLLGLQFAFGMGRSR